MEVSLETIHSELSGYPSSNVLKHITLKAHIHCDISQITGGLEREGLMRLFTQTLGVRSSFPSLRCVDLVPISHVEQKGRVTEEAFREELEQVAIGLRAMNLPFRFRFMKLEVLENWRKREANQGIDRWWKFMVIDDIVDSED